MANNERNSVKLVGVVEKKVLEAIWTNEEIFKEGMIKKTF